MEKINKEKNFKKLTEIVSARFSLDENIRLKKLATFNGVSVSYLVRMIVLKELGFVYPELKIIHNLWADFLNRNGERIQIRRIEFEREEKKKKELELIEQNLMKEREAPVVEHKLTL